MNKNVTIGIVVVLALLIVGWWYWAMMMPKQESETLSPNPSESINGVAVPSEQASIELSGTWRSTDDARFIREFKSDGTVIDSYEGDEGATTQGSWNFVEDPSKEKAELPVVKDAHILKLQFPEEVLYFALIDLSDTNLTLSYLSRGNTLNFTRVK